MDKVAANGHLVHFAPKLFVKRTYLFPQTYVSLPSFH